MRCPKCNHDEDRVLETRVVQEGAQIRRRRECAGCGERFTTKEYVELSSFQVVKKDDRREPFVREKLINGLVRACEKRPVSRGIIDEVAERIESELSRTGRPEVQSADIGQRVLLELKALDPVAYVRFASVYLNFNDIRQFLETIENFPAVRKGETYPLLGLNEGLASARGVGESPKRRTERREERQEAGGQ